MDVNIPPKATQWGETHLKQGMPGYNTQKTLQPLPPALNHLIGEAVRKDLSGQRRNIDSSGLMLKDIAECFEV
jgi:hypothetical protein